MAASSALTEWTTRLAGKSFLLAGKHYNLPHYQKLAEAAGGTPAAAIHAQLDYLVLVAPRGTKALEKEAEKLNKSGASIQAIDLTDFVALLAPSRDEALAMLHGGAAGLEIWSALTLCQVPLPDMSGVDLHGINLGGAFLANLTLDGADLSGVCLNSHFTALHHVNFEGASIVGYFQNMTDCNLKKATLNSSHFSNVQFLRCDFSEAVMQVHGFRMQLSDCRFVRADLANASLDQSKFVDCDFTGARLAGVRLLNSDLSGCKLAQAKLVGADLTAARLHGADFTGADLSGACLMNADLTDAIIDGANFTAANIFGAKLDGLDPGRATGLDPQNTTLKVRLGPHVQELQDQAKNATSLVLSADIELEEGYVSLHIASYKWGVSSNYSMHKDGTSAGHGGYHNQPVGDSMRYFAQRFPDGKLRFDSVAVRAQKAALPGKELKRLALAAWCEAFGVDVPSEDDLKNKQKTQKVDQAALREQHLGDLRQGAKGVERWNALKPELLHKLGKLNKADLSGLDLEGVKFHSLDVEEANFADSNLGAADFGGARLAGTSFKNATAKGANFGGVKALDADFSGCRFEASHLSWANLTRARFEGATLNEVNFTGSNLSGADFSKASLTDCKFEHAKFDEETHFPRGHALDKTMVWKGKGSDPRLPKVKIKKSTGPVDLTAFMKQVEANTDASKLAKALSMLKADRFKLYAQVEKDFLVGVVKSQTDANLVYSCRLAADGVYGCCTQNLNICGGLRGSLCKHLLVLIVGLANNKELELGDVQDWIANSRSKKPLLDKDAMGETFLKYKGAEAGEVDWRPTETIPEDYYAL